MVFKTQFHRHKVTMCLVDNAVFITSPAKIRVPGVCSPDPKPLVMFAGGSWISDTAKAMF